MKSGCTYIYNYNIKYYNIGVQKQAKLLVSHVSQTEGLTTITTF